MTTSSGRPEIWRLHHIGHFYTDLAIRIFGGEKTSGTWDIGDIENYELDARIEVKGRSNNNMLNIYSDQLDKALDEKGFPFNNHLYAIFSYRNSWRGEGRWLSNETNSRESMDKFLAVNTMYLFVVDADILVAIRSINGLRYERCHGEKSLVINMGKKTLSRFANRPNESLAKYKLKKIKVAVRNKELRFRGYKMAFKMIFIVRHRQLKKLLSIRQLKLFPDVIEFPEAGIAAR